MRASSLLLALVFVGCVSSCRSGRYDPTPVISGSLLDPASRELIEAKLTKRASQLGSFRTLAQATMTEGTERQRYRYSIAFSRPQKYRIEALPSQGALSLHLLISNPKQALFVVPPEKLVLEGTGEQLIKAALGVALSTSELLSYCVGHIPSDLLKQGTLAFYNNIPAKQLELIDSNFWHYFKVDAETLDLLEIQVREQFRNTLRAKITYGAYEDYGSIRLPREVQIYLPRKDFTLSFRYMAPEANPVLHDRLFEIHIPSSYRWDQL